MKNSDLKEKCDSFFKHNFFFIYYAHKINNNYTYYQRHKKRLSEKARKRYHQKGGHENAKV